LTGAEHVKPFWFFAAIFPFALLPWSAFLPPAAVEAGRCFRAALRIGRKPSPGPGTGRVHPPGEDDAILFLVIWILVVVGLFSVSNCKLIPYILPACPAAALLLGWYFDRKMESGSVLRWCAAVTALLLVAVIPVVARLARADDTLPAEQMAALVRMIQGALLLGGGGLILALFRVRLIPAAVGFVLLLTLGPLMAGVISATRHFKIGALLEGLPDPLPPEIVVAEWKSYDRSLNFYLRRRVVLIDAAGELAFGQSLEESAEFFRTGRESVRELTRKGPLLINLRPADWAECREGACLKLVAANNKNLLAGNDAFFRLTQLQPWPDEALVRPPRLLLPRKQP